MPLSSDEREKYGNLKRNKNKNRMQDQIVEYLIVKMNLNFYHTNF